MARTIKSAAEVADKWARRAAGATAEFEAGVKGANVDWATGALGGGAAYAAGVQAGIARNALQAGITRAGNDKWKRKVTTTGVPRWSQGVTAAKQDMADGIAKPLDVISRILPSLPPRGPRGAPQNMDRAAMLAKALADSRTHK
jgi:hypothetical protein